MKNTILTLVSALLLVGCGGVQPREKGVADAASSAVEYTRPEILDASKYKEYGITQILRNEDRFIIEAAELYELEGLDFDSAALNDIRFYQWEERHWLDNNYIRTVRIYLDALCSGEMSKGEIERRKLHQYDQYKDALRGQFVVNWIQPFSGGGAFLSLIPIEKPNLVIEAWVYSFVGGEFTIEGYEVRGFEVSVCEELSCTKEEILERIKGSDLYKLW